MRDRHKDSRVTWTYVCAECGEEFRDKKKVSTHVNRMHTGKAMKKDPKEGAFPCDYCEETFASSRSRSMHVRNKHAAAQSARLAGESSQKSSADSQPRHWDGETVQRFIRAMFVVGTGSNVEIAKEMKSKKTAHNVKGFKLKFLKENPNWRTEYSHLDPSVVPTDSEQEEREVTTKTEIAIEKETTVETETVIATEKEPTIEMGATLETGTILERETTVEIEATTGTEVTVETQTTVGEDTMEKESTMTEPEATMGTETTIKKEITVETETTVEEATEEKEPTTETADTQRMEKTLERETTGEAETTTILEREVTMETEIIVEAEPLVPHVHEATGEPPTIITIAYPLQNSLECPHCPVQFPGERLEDLRRHLQDHHPDQPCDWLYLCAFCAEGMNAEEDTIQHMLREHGDALRSLPRTGIIQARAKLGID